VSDKEIKMPSKEQAHINDKPVAKKRSSQPAPQNFDALTQQQIHLATISQSDRLDLSSLTASDVLQLQRTIGNQAVDRLLTQRAQTQPTQKHGSTDLGAVINRDRGNGQPVDAGIQRSIGHKGIIQRRAKLESDKLNVVGENHHASEQREEQEKVFCKEKTNDERYESEDSMKVGKIEEDRVHGDDLQLRMLQMMTSMVNIYDALSQKLEKKETAKKDEILDLVANYKRASETMGPEVKQYSLSFGDYQEILEEMIEWDENAGKIATSLNNLAEKEVWDEQGLVADVGKWSGVMKKVLSTPIAALRKAAIWAKENWVSGEVRGSENDYTDEKTYADRGVSMQRSIKMDEFARTHGATMKGVWKVGQTHVDEIRKLYPTQEPDVYNLVNASDFETEGSFTA
jgi:hypothetical protein